MKRYMFATLVLTIAAAFSLAACGSGDDGAGAGEAAAIGVTDAWARSPMMDRGAVYFTITNTGEEADSLIGAATDIAGRVELHETKMMGGQAEMAPVDSVEIAAGGTMVFEPGGYHVMLFDLVEPMEVGTSISLTLTFEGAGEVQVEAMVEAFVEEEDGEM